MSATIDAVYREGVFLPSILPDLPDGTAVRLNVVPAVPAKKPATGAEALALMQQVIAKFNPTTDNPEVTSENVDEILYGGPNGVR